MCIGKQRTEAEYNHFVVADDCDRDEGGVVVDRDRKILASVLMAVLENKMGNQSVVAHEKVDCGDEWQIPVVVSISTAVMTLTERLRVSGAAMRYRRQIVLLISTISDLDFHELRTSLLD